MTAYNPLTETPPAIDTAEKAVAHLLFLLNDLYGSLTYQELPGALMERVIDQNIITAADGTRRLITRISQEIDPSYVLSTGDKLWTFVRPYSNGIVPAGYKVD